MAMIMTQVVSGSQKVVSLACSAVLKVAYRAARGRLAAGTPKLLCFESTTLHDVPTLPAHYMPRPEQWDLRASLVSGVRGDGTVVGLSLIHI